MEAVNNYIIVKKDSDEVARGGIILPSFRKNDDGNVGYPFTGIVASVGDLVSSVKPGDHIVFNDLCSPWIIQDVDRKIQVLIMKDKDVIGVLNG